MIGAEPMMAASVSADVPNWFLSLTFAPALISARTSSRSSFDAAHMIAVVPSGPGAFGFAPFASSCNAAARSPRSAASSSVASAAIAIELAATNIAIAATSRVPATRQF